MDGSIKTQFTVLVYLNLTQNTSVAFHNYYILINNVSTTITNQVEEYDYCVNYKRNYYNNKPSH